MKNLRFWWVKCPAQDWMEFKSRFISPPAFQHSNLPHHEDSLEYGRHLARVSTSTFWVLLGSLFHRRGHWCAINTSCPRSPRRLQTLDSRAPAQPLAGSFLLHYSTGSCAISSSESQRNTKFILKSAFLPQDECRPAKWEIVRLSVQRVFLTFKDTKSLKFAEPGKALQEPAMMGPHGAGQGFLCVSS